MTTDDTLQDKIDESPHPWRDREIVESLYHGEELSQRQIAERLGCNRRTAERWFQKHDIEARSRKEACKGINRVERVSFRTRQDGYEEAMSNYRKSVNTVRIHRLVAVVEFGIEAVKGNVVHHKNSIPWDNRPDNLEVMGWREHAIYHEYAESKWGSEGQ
jgi:transposase